MICLDDLINNVSKYNIKGIERVRKAYEYADIMHGNQLRQSGEPYITHPLNVAYILSEMYADTDTLCAALLHDTLEDTKATKKEIEDLFNKEVANLVDGVTKISKMNFSTKEEEKSANNRKIILGITNDVRIIIIKLADRLHNMRTLQYKSKYKQRENALETLEIFSPLAYLIGAYRIKSELEDLSLQYLKPDKYKHIEDYMNNNKDVYNSILESMKFDIMSILDCYGISNDIKIRTKNIYGIYKRKEDGYGMHDIHDLLSLKVMVNEIKDCYLSLGLVHKSYNPINDKFKDYICNPKTNLYQGLHTTVFGPKEKLVQTQIRTYEMDKTASFGLTAYWDMKKGDARDIMQKDLKNKFQFFKSLVAINSIFADNQAFVDQAKKELFQEKVYVYNSKGDFIELPKGSTIIDFASAMGDKYLSTLSKAYVNEHNVDLTYVLKNKDRVNLVCDKKLEGPKEEWLDNANTVVAQDKIKKLTKEVKNDL